MFGELVYSIRYGSGYSLQAKLGQRVPKPTTCARGNQEETVFSVANPALAADDNPHHPPTLQRLMLYLFVFT